jgi:hypothetical protein
VTLADLNQICADDGIDPKLCELRFAPLNPVNQQIPWQAVQNATPYNIGGTVAGQTTPVEQFVVLS